MTQFLQNKWLMMAVGAIAYAITTWLCLQPHKQLQQAKTTLAARQNTQVTVPVGPSWTFQNPEMSQIVAELKDEREALRVRATQLDELEARLHAESKEIFAITQAVYQLRTELDTVVSRVTAEESVNLKKLAKVYATMSPEGAGRILKEMEDNQLVKVLAVMRESESAPILESLGQGGKEEARRAAIISNRLRLTVSAAKKPATP